MTKDIRLVVSDFDGTLCTSDLIVSPHTWDSIVLLRRKGTAFAIATARPISFLRTVIPAEIYALVWKICHNGAQIFDESDNLLQEAGIDLFVQKNILQHLIDEDSSFSWYLKDQWMCNRTCSNADRKVYGIQDHYPGPVEADIAILAHSQAVKILALRPSNAADFRRRFETHASIYESRLGDLLMISANNHDKATAATLVLEAINSTWAQTLVIGDELNDLPLFRKAHRGIAIRGAPQALRDLPCVIRGVEPLPEEIGHLLKTV